ncbi:hypothetical protein LFM09_49665 [Lentzea alba]|uniref:hypothetical protein n=1 Tax=Lentzea alba TaxID=2714351 RepID=UPI0039BF71E8
MEQPDVAVAVGPLERCGGQHHLAERARGKLGLLKSAAPLDPDRDRAWHPMGVHVERLAVDRMGHGDHRLRQVDPITIIGSEHMCDVVAAGARPSLGSFRLVGGDERGTDDHISAGRSKLPSEHLTRPKVDGATVLGGPFQQLLG